MIMLLLLLPLKVSMVKIHVRKGLRLHRVFFLERVIVALKRAQEREDNSRFELHGLGWGCAWEVGWF